jgi:diguanylate cyclase (GGDEF)-like protein
MITDEAHTVFIANNGMEAIDIFEKNAIELILMDIEMPGMNGFELTAHIRQIESHWIPIIFLSHFDSEEYLSKGIDAGGDDYLTKPVKPIILRAKIKAMARIAQIQHQLDLANKKLENLNAHDALTSLFNRRALVDVLEREWNNHKRHQSELSVLMLDIDYFKEFNDCHGHIAGDECLCEFAELLNRFATRSTDIVARYGGEEFVIILPNTPIIGARYKAKEIIKILNNGLIGHDNSPISKYVTTSIGIVSTDSNASSPKELINFADKALYQAKNSGRNCSVVYQAEAN